MRPNADTVRARLAVAFPGASIAVTDDSHLHAGHAGAAGGAGHYSVRIVDDVFAGRGPVARHRLVYDAVADWIPHCVHALAIVAKTPAEASGPATDPAAVPPSSKDSAR
jgi:BolA protein